ncbi:autotransporter secretion outer membrane protein TamA [Methylobacterium sp. 275MFSha3.1]|uniref:autotransporter assembly complex protein TamA n=1 Tax=Methylobacterium sp. 275MFSha3.1 TaxID=1502746 RepID=UPI0008A7CCB4|nr:autotransporter assembly complex family protein [Methylobacterium sp. 275MFSha3.1]SEH70767.1 autotransporter secretion outer membrane protein TamA [Methylobacterium sp. 275MFSha3.1]
MRRASPPRLAALALALLVAAGSQPARAFDLFGLFGSEPEPPPPSATALPYTLRITGTDDSDVLRALQDTSTLYRLRQEPPPDGEGLLRRAETDRAKLADVLSGYGYYQGTVSIRIDGAPVPGQAATAVGAAEAWRNRGLVPVRIAVDLGPLYHLRRITVRDPAGNPFPDAVLPARVTRVDDDVPARSATVLAREAQIVDQFRAQGHPFAKVIARDPVVDDSAHVMDVTFTVAPGPVAGLGPVTVSGAPGIDPATIRSFIYAEPGDPYSPQAVAAIRRSVARIEGIGGVRVREGTTLDADGNLPLFVAVTERERNLVGVSARYSTVDGPGVRAYYANRNLFGGGESFRVDADIYYLGLGNDPFANQRKLAGIGTNGLGGRLSATYVQPALWGTRNDFLANAFITREVQQSYLVDGGGVSGAIRHRFSDTFSAQIGLDAQAGRSKDALGTVNYRLIGVPASVTYDSTDSLLDPTRGVRAIASLAVYPGAISSPGIVVAKAQGSTYYALDDEARVILAGRVGFGSVSGAPLGEIPDNFRFFAGGGGSVRGYPYRTLGPIGPFNLPIGGRSLLEASLEARIKVTDTIGVVPFFDAGTAFASATPDFDEKIRKSVGIGLRYYTGIGPIRADVAFPLDPYKGGHVRPAVLYLSLGQAF